MKLQVATTVFLLSLAAAHPLPQSQSLSADEIRAAAAVRDLQETPAERDSQTQSGQVFQGEALNLGRTGNLGEFIVTDRRLSSDRWASGSVSLARLRRKVPTEARESFNRAEKFARRNQRDKAAGEFEAAIRRDPGFEDAHRELGVQYANLGRLSDAEAQLREAVVLDASDWVGYYNLAVILIEEGKIRDAEQSARRALEVSGNSPRVQIIMALILLRNAATRAEAEEDLRSAARTVPDAAALLRLLPLLPSPSAPDSMK